jgi:hypothetical protein
MSRAYAGDDANRLVICVKREFTKGGIMKLWRLCSGALAGVMLSTTTAAAQEFTIRKDGVRVSASR